MREMVTEILNLDRAVEIAHELASQGRKEDARLIAKMVALLEERESPGLMAMVRAMEEEPTPEDIAALARGLADIKAGKIIPHEVVKRGPKAVEVYRRRRDAPKAQP